MRHVPWLVVLLVLAGCAPVKNTPAQDLARERWTKCRHFDMVLQEIKPDGTIWVHPAADGTKDVNAWQTCMRQAAVDQRQAQPPDIQVSATPRTASTVPTPLSGPVVAPTWKPGNEWSYRWESPRGKGTFMWTVDRVEKVDGTDYYVVKSGERREIYWRKSDFVLLMDKLDGAVELRQTPVKPWQPWPLTPGRSWTMHYKEDRPGDRQTTERTRACRVEAQEDVTVPAGTFRTVKVACTDAPTGQPVYEAWYAPQAKQWVRERTHFNYGVRERELLNYRVD